jgi:uncharacterized MAPEG superfamily protein
MTIQLWCLLAGLVLPYVWAFGTVPFRAKQFGNFDLNYPRVQAEQLKEGGARVWAAQSNAWEALAVFAVANLAATMAGVDPAGNWATAAMIWVAARVSHGVFYLADVAPLRVLSFATGFGMSGWIIAMAIQQ